MEKAERLTGRTIQAVIGLARSWRCPKHGAAQGLQTGDGTGGTGTGKQGRGVGGGWGSLTHGETHRGGHERRNKEGNATPQNLQHHGTKTVTDALSRPSELQKHALVCYGNPVTKGNPGELRNV